MYLKSKFIEKESTSVVARGWGYEWQLIPNGYKGTSEERVKMF